MVSKYLWVSGVSGYVWLENFIRYYLNAVGCSSNTLNLENLRQKRKIEFIKQANISRLV